MSRTTLLPLALALALPATALPVHPVRAQEEGATFSMPGTASGKSVVVETGAGRIVSLSGGAANIVVADPKVVEVRPASATTLFMFGVTPGRTTVAAMDGAGHIVTQFEVTVRASGFGAAETNALVARNLPGADVRTETTLHGVILRGRVKDAATAAQVQALASASLPKDAVIDNRLSVASSTQVGLRVRIVEMSRTLTRELGLNWSATGVYGSGSLAGGVLTSAIGIVKAGSPDLNVVLDALSTDNLVKTLAEPNLVTKSGETASFLAGGQFPVPVSSTNGAISVTYENYGVQLSFVPTVMSDNRISLHVRPEVSAIDSANSVAITSGSGASTTTNSTINVPALTVRRADTTVELGSGQSFAIAGLLQDTFTHNVNAFPFLGDIPVLGALFRSDSFQRAETELVIVVTPYIVRPVSDPSAIHTPDENYTPPNEVDRYLMLRQVGHKSGLQPARTTTTSGYLVE